MKNFRLVAFLAFAVCAFCLPAQAQEKLTYEGDNGKGGKITIIITQRPNGYEVSGDYTSPDGGVCKIRGSYFPSGQRLRGTCEYSNGDKAKVTGSKQARKDAFQVEVGFGGGEYGGTIVAKRADEKPAPSTEEASNTGCNSFIGTWKTSFGTMTFSVSGSEIRAGYDFDGGSIVGKLSPDGRTLSGRYTEKEAQGTFQFTLSDDGQSFTGKWNRTSGRRQPPSGDWEGKCISQ